MLDQLVILLRAMQFYTHNAHNSIVGATFFEDHEFLGDLYQTYEDGYDAIVERMIGLGKPVDLVKSQVDAAVVIQKLKATSNPTEAFDIILKLEKSLCQKIEQCLSSEKYSEGTKQFLGNLCDDSEKRQYKLGQRVK